MGKKLTIAGRRVHDIGYRYFLMEASLGHGIERFRAINKLNERQEVIAFVDGGERQLEDFLEFIKSNFPQDAEVDEIMSEDYAGYVPKIESFALVFNVGQSRKFIGVGKDVRKQIGISLEKQDSALNKMDSMLEKQAATIQTIKEEGEKTRDALKEHLAKDIARLYEEIDEIKATLARVVEKVGA
jgi:acylphosphatase